MATGKAFAEQVRLWARANKERLPAIRKESIQRMVEEMQATAAEGGHMAVDTGFLRSSLTAQKGPSTIPVTERPPIKGRGESRAPVFAPDPGPVGLVLASLGPDETITIGWSANYSRHVEYGTNGRPGRAFMRLGLQRWPQIVDQVAAELLFETKQKGRGG